MSYRALIVASALVFAGANAALADASDGHNAQQTVYSGLIGQPTAAPRAPLFGTRLETRRAMAVSPTSTKVQASQPEYFNIAVQGQDH